MLIKNVEICLENLNEYILNHRIVNDNEHIFFTKNLLITIILDTCKLYLSFLTTTKPESAADIALYFNNIKDVKIIIQSSFFIEDGIKIIQGMEAFKKTEEKIAEKYVKECRAYFDYTNILMRDDGFEC